jgi:hypothetical protein
MVGKNMRDPKRILKRSFNFFRNFWKLFGVHVVKTLKKINTTGKSVGRVCQTHP